MSQPPDYQRIHDEILRLPTPDLLGYLPYRRQESDTCFGRPPAEPLPRCEQGLPVPPEALRVTPDYGRSDAEFLALGKTHVAAMKDALARAGCPLPVAPWVLDFGCAAGRMTRWLLPEAKAGRVVGADIGGDAIAWCQQHLSPPFSFLTTTLQPHLPFRDRSFDLVFSGSVFTHIDDLADAWLAELARILKPGGCAYLTIHDESSIALLGGKYRDSYFGQILAKRASYAQFTSGEFSKFTLNRGLRSQVFYRRAHFTKMAEPWFKVHAYDDAAYLYQTAVTLEAR